MDMQFFRACISPDAEPNEFVCRCVMKMCDHVIAAEKNPTDVSKSFLQTLEN